MNKHIVFWMLIPLLFSGCLTEQERRERARQEEEQRVLAAKEAAEARLKLRASKLEAYWSDIAAHNVATLQDYIKEQVWRYRRDEEKSAELHQMLSHWVDVDGENVETAEANLEAFGIKYMPNAWSEYEKVRDAAKECQQVFNENFTSVEDPKSEGWRVYCSALRGLSKCRTAYFRRRDELVHFYLLHKVGGASGDDLAAYDCKKRYVWLLEKEEDPAFGLTQFSAKDEGSKKNKNQRGASRYIPLDGKAREFAAKYLPETFLHVENLEGQLQESGRLFLEIVADMKMFSYSRYDLSKIACYEKHEYISDILNTAYSTIRELHIEHRMMTIDIDRLTSLDKSTSVNLKKFSSAVKDYISKRSAGPVFDVDGEMTEFFPERNYVCVWQFQALGFYLSSYYGDISDVRRPMNTQSDTMTERPVSVGYSRGRHFGVDIDRAVYRGLLNDELMKYAVDPSSYKPKGRSYGWGYEMRIFTPKGEDGQYGFLGKWNDRYRSRFDIGAKMMDSTPFLCVVKNVEALVQPLGIGVYDTNRRSIVKFSCDWSQPMLTTRALEIDNVLYRFEIEKQVEDKKRSRRIDGARIKIVRAE